MEFSTVTCSNCKKKVTFFTGKVKKSQFDNQRSFKLGENEHVCRACYQSNKKFELCYTCGEMTIITAGKFSSPCACTRGNDCCDKCGQTVEKNGDCGCIDGLNDDEERETIDELSSNVLLFTSGHESHRQSISEKNMYMTMDNISDLEEEFNYAA